MDHPKQVAILRELMAHIANSTTARTSAVGSNRADVYTSPDRLQLEQQHIFADTPLVAALSCDIPVPETFITQDAAGTPFLLVRGQDGRARAFLNACRHRGTRLVDAERGRSARISCPFHAWTYDLEGKLVGIARRESFGSSTRAPTGSLRCRSPKNTGSSGSRPGRAPTSTSTIIFPASAPNWTAGGLPSSSRSELRRYRRG